MKQLQSLSSFQQKSINRIEMLNIKGGVLAGETGAGTTCVPTSSSSTGCCAYISDYITEAGRLNFSPTNGTMANSDVSQPCEP